jgi:hypothetical protein
MMVAMTTSSYCHLGWHSHQRQSLHDEAEFVKVTIYILDLLHATRSAVLAYVDYSNYNYLLVSTVVF